MRADTAATVTQLYKPLRQAQDDAWGEVRYQFGTLPTQYTYTGQYSHTADFGLMFYVARWYDPYLNRFIQPDTIIPAPFNPMAFDRYAYVFNSPLNYIDPTGHFTEEAIRKYLIGIYGEQIGINMLLEWQDDEAWWDMMSKAEAGDILFGTVGINFGNNTSPTSYEPFAVSFQGEGQSELTGIELVKSGTNANYWLRQAPPSAACYSIGCPWWLSTTAGFSLNKASDALLDWLNIEANDITINIGPLYFNFQPAPGGGLMLEPD